MRVEEAGRWNNDRLQLGLVVKEQVALKQILVCYEFILTGESRAFLVRSYGTRCRHVGNCRHGRIIRVDSVSHFEQAKDRCRVIPLKVEEVAVFSVVGYSKIVIVSHKDRKSGH